MVAEGVNYPEGNFNLKAFGLSLSSEQDDGGITRKIKIRQKIHLPRVFFKAPKIYRMGLWVFH